MRAVSSEQASTILIDLERDGIALLPGLVGAEQLQSMQRAFTASLRRMRWNDFDGYEKTEPHRHMVQNVLLLDQGFVDVALHPLVQEALQAYIGPNYGLNEAKGWLSNPTREDFNGWHGDCWYDQEAVTDRVPREVKLGFYLTDVRSGFFNYIKGTHGRPPRVRVPDAEVERMHDKRIAEMKAPAGSAFLFDTSGIHRQSVPILEHRQAVFFNYHDADVPLQKEDVDYYRYHPLLLNAAFLGGLDAEAHRVLGFGNKKQYIPSYERKPRHTAFQKASTFAFDVKLQTDIFTRRVLNRLKRMAGGKV